jgi:hypothetical protein
MQLEGCNAASVPHEQQSAVRIPTEHGGIVTMHAYVGSGQTRNTPGAKR